MAARHEQSLGQRGDDEARNRKWQSGSTCCQQCIILENETQHTVTLLSQNATSPSFHWNLA